MSLSIADVCSTFSLLTPSTLRFHFIDAIGHKLTGQVAQQLLTPETAEQVKLILSTRYDGLLSRAALWADTVKHQPEFKYVLLLFFFALASTVHMP